MEIDQILEERGDRYGDFVVQAIIAQNIKAAMKRSPNWEKMPRHMREALEMIASKMGRILNGDFGYIDSWVDVAGYAQLVVDQLESGRDRADGVSMDHQS